jgi:hypothetical protein
MKYLTSHSDFRALLKFLSPKTFQVVAPNDLLTFAKKMSSKALGNPSDYEKLSQFCIQMGPVLEHTVSVASTRASGGQSIPHQLQGQLALELYFRQLMTSTLWNLDLAHEGFSLSEKEVVWSPKALFWEVNPAFAEGVRKMYLGFYCNQMSTLEEGLKSINLLPAKDVFIQYFGQEDQTQTPFKLKSFQKAFDRIFEVCLESNIRLQPDFLALGIMMLSLYQNLEFTGLTYNVKGTFERLVKLDSEPS